MNQNGFSGHDVNKWNVCILFAPQFFLPKTVLYHIAGFRAPPPFLIHLSFAAATTNESPGHTDHVT